MNTLRSVAAVLASVSVLFAVAAARGDQPPAGGVYYGQRLPGEVPEPFAREAVEALGMTRAPVFSADGREMFWARAKGRHLSVLVSSRLEGANWTTPEALPFSTGEFFDHNPAVSRDGRRIVFASDRPIPGKAATTLPGTDVPTSDLWVAQRSAGAWSPPVALAPSINTTADEDCPVLAGDDRLFFSSSRPVSPASPGSIYLAKPTAAGWADPERLPTPVSEAGEMVSGVAPDGGFLLFYSMKPGESGGLRVSFREPGGSWTQPLALAPALGGLRAYAASVTHDGRWILLTSFPTGGPKLYWVSADVLKSLRSKR